MILKGNARGGAADLSAHLLKEENDHIEVHELRGFVSDNLTGALNEIYALSRGTKCRQHMYSLSLNPPETEQVSTGDFIAAIERVEAKLGLGGQPRAVVFHEKEGRRHAHAVWSRINTAEMKAVHLYRDRMKLKAVSRELFLEHGWQMPPGLVRESERDPLNFTLDEWQQAKRTGRSAKEIKGAIQDAWAVSDNKASFTHALAERGFRLARGDKGRFVAVDHHGEAWAVARQARVKAKAMRERLGDEKALPSVHEVTAEFAGDMAATMDRHKTDLEKSKHIQIAELKEDRQRLVESQRQERRALAASLQERRNREALERQARFRKGLGGLWDRMRGHHKRIQAQNEHEAEASAKRDAQEKDRLIFNQLNQRRMLKLRVGRFRGRYLEQSREIAADKAGFERKKAESLQALRDEVFNRAAKSKPKTRRPSRGRRRGPEPEL